MLLWGSLRVCCVLLLVTLAGCGATLPGDWLALPEAGGDPGPAGRSAAGGGAGTGVIGQAGVGLPRGGSGVVTAGTFATAGTVALAGVGGGAGKPAPKRDRDGDGFEAPKDCDDSNAKVFPGAPEACCDGIDSNCDGSDNAPSCSCMPMFVDRDGDGYPGSFIKGPKWDCDDSDAATHPFAMERCDDGRDNDCNGAADASDKACIDFDRDGDGYGASVDCNDKDARIHPRAAESCDGIDNDCDGDIDPAPCPRSVDTDGDGFKQSDDCNDWDSAIHPGAAETCCDSVDSNCDGVDDPRGVMCSCFDADGDGYVVGPVDGKLADCNDQDRFIHPGAPEICTDGIDNDCDRRVDGTDNECFLIID